MMLNRRVVALSLILSVLSLPVAAQNGSGDMLSRIPKEAMERSQIMKTMHMLTDLYGPRLTGSPNHKAAAEWAVKQMTAWGLENAHLEPWNRQFLRRSAIAVAAAGFSRSQLSGAVRNIVLTGPAKKVLILGAGISAYSSWMQGAFASGLRAVKEIDEAVKV